MEWAIFYPSPIGTIRIQELEGRITALHFSDKLPQGVEARETPLLKRAVGQLEAYFAGTRRDFDLPLNLQGTDFQKRVWQALQKIPYGTTWSYKKLAEASGSPNGYRAVGLANNRNPVSILVPCHRVIGSDGSLTGYGGGLDIKSFLLKLENALPEQLSL